MESQFIVSFTKYAKYYFQDVFFRCGDIFYLPTRKPITLYITYNMYKVYLNKMIFIKLKVLILRFFIIFFLPLLIILFKEKKLK